MHQALARLARCHDEAGESPSNVPSPRAAAPIPSYGDRSTQFAALVAGQAFGSVLCYSQRLALLRTAARLGLSRFEANLIIASVQHGREPREAAPRPIERFASARPASKWPRMIGLAIAFESLIAAAAWFTFNG
jgi:hypothetical protein